MIMARYFFDHLAKELEGALRSGLLQEGVERNLPGALAATVFTGQFVNAPLQGLPEPEVIAVERQHLLRFVSH